MIVAGTGHRPDKLGGYVTPAKQHLFKFAHDYFRANRPEHIITGMAQGWDFALASAANTLRIPYTCAVPFLGQESRWPKDAQEFYRIMLDGAKNVVVVSDGDYAVWKMQTRNEWMVDNCDTVVALWNGTSGGTGNCVAYAQKVGKPIINVWDHYKEKLNGS